MISYKEKIAEILAPQQDGRLCVPMLQAGKDLPQGTTDDRTDFGRGDRSGVCF